MNYANPSATEPTPAATIVVPCYNEAARLPADTFSAFMAEHPEYAWCFVDDGSTDATRTVLEELCAPHGARACVHAMPRNSGKAEAVRSGILAALDRWAAPWVGYWDADLATPLEEIPRFVAYVGAHDPVRILCGSRWLHMGARIERHATRHYIGRVFATIASNALGLPIYDTQCGAKLIEAALARELFAKPFVSRWVFDVEMLARAIQTHGRASARAFIAEIPLETWIDRDGSKVKVRHAFRVPYDLRRIYRTYLR